MKIMFQESYFANSEIINATDDSGSRIITGREYGIVDWNIKIVEENVVVIQVGCSSVKA